MFEAARRLVYAQGVQVSLEELGFEQVIELAGVSRSSAYRLWPYKGDFVQDLLCDLAGPSWLGTAAFDQETIDLAANIVMSNSEKLSTPEGRRQVMLHAVRDAVAQNFKAIIESQEWHIYVALNASVRTAGDDESRLRIAAALQNSEMTFVDRMADFYSGMLDVLGLRFRSDAYTVRHLAVAGAAVVEGLALRRLITVAVDTAKRPPYVPDHGWSLAELLTTNLPYPEASDAQPWSLAALAFLGIVDTLTEPAVPDDDAS
jgi:AcrR family transcriptional regulator